MGNLGELLRRIRLSKDWSVREAAKKMGISPSYLSSLEKGIDPRTGKYSNPKPDILRLIAKTYDYPLEELMQAAGHLNEEMEPDRSFDLTVFVSNLNLIMGDMSIEEFSADIKKKTGYTISTKQIRSYINGDIEPFPGTINILSNYARVTPDFWYCFNTKDTLEQERKKYEENLIKSTDNKTAKEYYQFTKLQEDLRNWILREESQPYLKLFMTACMKKIDPEKIKSWLDKLDETNTGG